MTFWSSQTIETNLAKLTDHPDPDQVDCNALTLRVGDEVYITPGLDEPAPNLRTKMQLKPGQAFPIPPGRFAFLLTQEAVTIPRNVMGLISIKATYKLKGLVNVSGFHVDPGWKGPLIFTVFNAGPSTIHLQQGLPLFLLWIAALDEESEKFRTKPSETCIPPATINNITGVVDTIYALENRVKDDLKALGDKQEAFRDQVADVRERQNKVLLYLGIAAVALGAVVGVGTKMMADRLFPAQPAIVAVPAAKPPPAIALPAGRIETPSRSAEQNAVAPPDDARRGQ